MFSILLFIPESQYLIPPDQVFGLGYAQVFLLVRYPDNLLSDRFSGGTIMSILRITPSATYSSAQRIWKLLTGTSVVLKLRIQLTGTPSQFVSICFLRPSAYGSRNGGVEIRTVMRWNRSPPRPVGRQQGPALSQYSGIASISCGSFFQSSAASWKLFGQYFLLFPQHRFLQAFLQ